MAPLNSPMLLTFTPTPTLYLGLGKTACQVLVDLQTRLLDCYPLDSLRFKAINHQEIYSRYAFIGLDSATKSPFITLQGVDCSYISIPSAPPGNRERERRGLIDHLTKETRLLSDIKTTLNQLSRIPQNRPTLSIHLILALDEPLGHSLGSDLLYILQNIKQESDSRTDWLINVVAIMPSTLQSTSTAAYYELAHRIQWSLNANAFEMPSYPPELKIHFKENARSETSIRFYLFERNQQINSRLVSWFMFWSDQTPDSEIKPAAENYINIGEVCMWSMPYVRIREMWEDTLWNGLLGKQEEASGDASQTLPKLPESLKSLLSDNLTNAKFTDALVRFFKDLLPHHLRDVIKIAKIEIGELKQVKWRLLDLVRKRDTAVKDHIEDAIILFTTKISPVLGVNCTQEALTYDNLDTLNSLLSDHIYSFMQETLNTQKDKGLLYSLVYSIRSLENLNLRVDTTIKHIHTLQLQLNKETLCLEFKDSLKDAVDIRKFIAYIDVSNGSLVNTFNCWAEKQNKLTEKFKEMITLLYAEKTLNQVRLQIAEVQKKLESQRAKWGNSGISKPLTFGDLPSDWQDRLRSELKIRCENVLVQAKYKTLLTRFQWAFGVSPRNPEMSLLCQFDQLPFELTTEGRPISERFNAEVSTIFASALDNLEWERLVTDFLEPNESVDSVASELLSAESTASALVSVSLSQSPPTAALWRPRTVIRNAQQAELFNELPQRLGGATQKRPAVRVSQHHFDDGVRLSYVALWEALPLDRVKMNTSQDRITAQDYLFEHEKNAVAYETLLGHRLGAETLWLITPVALFEALILCEATDLLYSEDGQVKLKLPSNLVSCKPNLLPILDIMRYSIEKSGLAIQTEVQRMANHQLSTRSEEIASVIHEQSDLPNGFQYFLGLRGRPDVVQHIYKMLAEYLIMERYKQRIPYTDPPISSRVTRETVELISKFVAARQTELVRNLTLASQQA